jgi:hypothetical protein
LLVQSLKDLGYNPTVHQEGVQLSNSYSKSKSNVHLVVPKEQFNGSYGDLGFERTKKGFVMHADHIDISRFNLKGLNKTYAENKLKRYVGSTTQCSILSRRENKNGQIEIQLRVQ